MVRDDCQQLSDLVNESLFTKVASCEKRNWQACSDIICVPYKIKPHNRKLEDLGCVKASLKKQISRLIQIRKNRCFVTNIGSLIC